MKFSVIIPLYNEERNIPILLKELISALKNYEYELIYINDGSIDDTHLTLKSELRKISPPHAKIINLKRNFGQSYAFKIGIDNALFPIVVLIDGDLQNNPADIPKAIEKIKKTKSEAVSILEEIRKNHKAEGIKIAR